MTIIRLYYTADSQHCQHIISMIMHHAIYLISQKNVKMKLYVTFILKQFNIHFIFDTYLLTLFTFRYLVTPVDSAS